MKKIILFLLLLSIPCLAAKQVPKTLEDQLALDNQKVIKYLQSLKASDTGKTLKGIKLSDRNVILKDHVFLERIFSAKNEFHVYLFRDGSKIVAYAWVDTNGKPLPIPPCPPNSEEEGQYVLSSDIYTWKDVQPEHGIVIMKCVTNKWINEIKMIK